MPIECIQDIIDEEEITSEMAESGEHIALRISGDSMLPRIASGDVAIIRMQSSVDDGEIAAVYINGNSVTLKKFYKKPDGVMLASTNPSFEPMFFSQKEVVDLPIKLLGKLVELRAKY